MQNYICINGKKAELTEEQMKALGIELPKVNPFAKIKGKKYFSITGTGKIFSFDGIIDTDSETDKTLYEIANYCTDKAIMEQRALHETLSRLLWRYAMENGGCGYWSIARNGTEFETRTFYHKYLSPTFSTKEIAKKAIEEIIKPFMKAHPEFEW